MSDRQHLVDSPQFTLATANVTCQLIRDGASADPAGGAVYARRVKHAARLWARRARSHGRNSLARLMIQEGRRRALEAARRFLGETRDAVAAAPANQAVAA